MDRAQVDSYQHRIRTAYHHAITDLGKQPGDWLSLTDLRPYVGGYREYVDAALREMLRDPEVWIIPESNQRMLTCYDREAAIVIGNQDKHLIAIGQGR